MRIEALSIAFLISESCFRLSFSHCERVHKADDGNIDELARCRSWLMEEVSIIERELDTSCHGQFLTDPEPAHPSRPVGANASAMGSQKL